MNGEKIESFKKFKKNGSKGELQHIYNSQGELLCHCAQFRGSGYYFTTEKELYAYCEGRGWLTREENIYYAKNYGINLKYNYYPIINEETLCSIGKAKLQRITFKVNEQLTFNLYCCLYRKKKQYFETEAEVYAYCQGKKGIHGGSSPFCYPKN
jgi:hypothetical protein